MAWLAFAVFAVPTLYFFFRRPTGTRA
jgi:hypothetical protein